MLTVLTATLVVALFAVWQGSLLLYVQPCFKVCRGGWVLGFRSVWIGLYCDQGWWAWPSKSV